MSRVPLFSISTKSLGGPEVEISIRAIGEDGGEVHLTDYRWASDASLPRPATSSERVHCEAQVTFNKGRWPDLLHVGGLNDRFVVVARRVFDVLRAGEIGRFCTFPVEAVSGLPKAKQMPEYLALLPATGVDIEWERTNVTPRRSPGHAFANQKLKRWVPRGGSWKGYDLFRVAAGKTCCCTLRFIELAREHRWTNFEFKPLDVRRDMPTEGIDYFAEQWPPESWYPRSPSEGMTAEQWVDAYMQIGRDARANSQREPTAGSKRLSCKLQERECSERIRPHDALMYDLAAEAVPLFIEILQHSNDDIDRDLAANMLLALAEHTRIDATVLGEFVLPVFESSLRRGEAASGHATIALNSYIEVPEDILALAHKATGKPPMILPAQLQQPPHS